MQIVSGLIGGWELIVVLAIILALVWFLVKRKP